MAVISTLYSKVPSNQFVHFNGHYTHHSLLYAHVLSGETIAILLLFYVVCFVIQHDFYILHRQKQNCSTLTIVLMFNIYFNLFLANCFAVKAHVIGMSCHYTNLFSFLYRGHISENVQSMHYKNTVD